MAGAGRLRLAADLGSEIPATFFGMHYEKPTPLWTPQTPYCDLGFGLIRIWDCGVSWRLVETAKGVFDWSLADALMDFAETNGLRVLWVLGQSPDWATTPNVSGNATYSGYPPNDMQDAADYAAALATRYGDRIWAYEVSNEANATFFWNGTVAQLAAMHRAVYTAVKAVSPNALVASASMSGSGVDYLARYLREDVLDYTDAVAVHTYVEPRQPEEVIYYLQNARGRMDGQGFGDVPLWNTEVTWVQFYENGVLHNNSTGAHNDIMTQAQACAYLARSVIATWLGGAEVYGFYGIDQVFSTIRLIDIADRSELLDAGRCYAFLSDLLVGGKLYGMSGDQNLYRCGFLAGDGRSGHVFWTGDDLSTVLDLAAYGTVTDVLGEPVADPAAVTVDMSPVFAFA